MVHVILENLQSSRILENSLEHSRIIPLVYKQLCFNHIIELCCRVVSLIITLSVNMVVQQVMGPGHV